jgi:hypothetical protein
MDIVGEMRELFVQISDKEALNWLNAIRPDPVYDFNKHRRLEGTCNWIFKTQKYQSWLEGTGNRDLWIVGIPGRFCHRPRNSLIEPFSQEQENLSWLRILSTNFAISPTS